jgi:hypothetical protein
MFIFANLFIILQNPKKKISGISGIRRILCWKKSRAGKILCWKKSARQKETAFTAPAPHAAASAFHLRCRRKSPDAL